MAYRHWLTGAKTAAIVASVPLLLGAESRGCATFATDPAPDMSGAWDVTYDDQFDVEVKIGANTYSATLPSTGGQFVVAHGGENITFEVDCTRPEVICPSEVWPADVAIRQDHSRYTHRIYLSVPRQTCPQRTVQPEADECGEGTLNPDCEEVCPVEVVTQMREAYGEIDNDERGFRFLVGAGIATNGVNCALLSLSVAQGDVATSGSAETEDWTVTDVDNGEVVTGYAGGCLWAHDIDTDGSIEAAVLGATLTITTGFDAVRQ
jgi:hypothetical protein